YCGKGLPHPTCCFKVTNILAPTPTRRTTDEIEDDPSVVAEARTRCHVSTLSPALDDEETTERLSLREWTRISAGGSPRAQGATSREVASSAAHLARQARDEPR